MAYDGVHYSGYQLQSNGISVQLRIEEVLAYLNRSPVRVFESSRTDVGVHAKGFVAFRLDKAHSAEKLSRAMNSRLLEDVRELKAFYARPDFNARKDATGKEHRYFLYNADIPPSCLAPY